MFKLGEVVFLEGIQKLKECKNKNNEFIYKRDELIIKKRLAVVELTHGLELILKAILIKKGYSINKIKSGIFKNSEKIANVIKKNRTVDLYDVIEFFKKTYPDLPFNNVNSLRRLRNQIIHRGTRIDEKKKEYFIGTIRCIIELYDKENIKHKRFIEQIKHSEKEI